MDTPASRACGIHVARLNLADYAVNFGDAHPPLTRAQSLIEAERCYYCHDAPCATACPTGIDIPSFIHRIAQDNNRGAARAILDGHIVLSRELAESGHFPAIDIERSASRVMHNVAEPQHIDDARRFRQLWSKYSKAKDLIQLGAYVPGHDYDLDMAVKSHQSMVHLLQQGMHTPAPMEESVNALHHIVAS